MVTILDSFSGKTKRVLWLLFAIQSWALWVTRNKFSIEGVFPQQPADVLYKLLIFLQQWRPLMKPSLLPQVDVLRAMIQDLFAKTHSQAQRHPFPGAT